MYGLSTRYNGGVTEFRVLGPLEALADDGEPLPLGGQKQRAVLALLLLRANRVVSTDFLVDALWGDNPPRTATTSLQNAISALRKLVGPDVLVTKAPGYTLLVSPDSYDLARFEALVREARDLEPAARAQALRDALALWRGDPLSDLALEQAFAADVLRLEELRLATLEDRLDAELAAGRHADVVPELISLVGANPLRERLRGQLMLAHYLCGRQDDALRTYRDARVALADIGLDPSPQLQELERRILRQEVPQPRLAATAADEAHYEEVAAALLGGRLVPVIGHDVSALADELARRIGYDDDGGDLTRVAQFVSLTRGPGPLHDELGALLESSSAPTAVHRLFAALPALLRERGQSH